MLCGSRKNTIQLLVIMTITTTLYLTSVISITDDSVAYIMALPKIV